MRRWLGCRSDGRVGRLKVLHRVLTILFRDLSIRLGAGISWIGRIWGRRGSLVGFHVGQVVGPLRGFRDRMWVLFVDGGELLEAISGVVFPAAGTGDLAIISTVYSD